MTTPLIETLAQLEQKWRDESKKRIATGNVDMFAFGDALRDCAGQLHAAIAVYDAAKVREGEDCPACKGSGEFPREVPADNGDPQEAHTEIGECPYCEGTGWNTAHPSAQTVPDRLKQARKEIQQIADEHCHEFGNYDYSCNAWEFSDEAEAYQGGLIDALEVIDRIAATPPTAVALQPPASSTKEET
jgi:hypothetical protein